MTGPSITPENFLKATLELSGIGLALYREGRADNPNMSEAEYVKWFAKQIGKPDDDETAEEALESLGCITAGLMYTLDQMKRGA
jgi:hypothetical protein